MYDVKQFKPVLYLVLLLGLSAFALAAETPGIWSLAMLGLGVNAWLVKSNRFVPMPRLVANVVTLMALLYVSRQVFRSDSESPPLLAIGQFLVFLQLVKLFEGNQNRDYAQLLILSLLLMVAACISTASLLFGLLMVLYLVLSFYCCLLFHLKVEADRAKTAMALPEDSFNPATLRQDQRFLTQSMRRLTGLVTVVSVLFAVAVFLFFPRGSGQGALGQMHLKNPAVLTGFSERISLGQINRIQQSEELVARVFVWKNGKAIQGTESLFLRGTTYDAYGARHGQGRQWVRTRQATEERDIGNQGFSGELYPAGDVWRQRVMLCPTGTRYLFALPGPMFSLNDSGRSLALRTGRPLSIRYSRGDDTIQTAEPLVHSLEYEVLSTNAPRGPDLASGILRQALLFQSDSDPKVLEQIRAYTLQPKVAGELLAKRSSIIPVQDSNEEIARRIEHHLRSGFSYTLDLTSQRSAFRGTDPVVAFLTTVKKGHCEYFASAMTLMCQSVGIPARVVAGFRCDQYNVVGGYYDVREAHAHTWVEVLTPRGWVTFDPTSGREDNASRAAGLLGSLKSFFDFVEYKWAEKVIAYDGNDRENVIRSVDAAATNAVIASGGLLRRLGQSLYDRVAALTQENSFWEASLTILILLMVLLALGIVLAILWYLLQKGRLRRRAARIGLDALPLGQQLRLARQLAFYDQLVGVLHRHRIVRPHSLTPLEFSRMLVFLPAEAYDTIHRLTRILYRVRFGHTRLSPARRRHLSTAVWRLSQTLEASHFSPTP